MVNVGPLEIVLVAIIALIVLGPARLPEAARNIGRGMREFRNALNSSGDDHDDYEDEDEEHEHEHEHDVPEEDVAEPPPLPREPPGTAADLPERG